MSEHTAAKIAVLVDGAGRRVTLGQLLQSNAAPTIMAATGTDEADIAAAISAASGPAPASPVDPDAAPGWLTGRAPAAAVDIGRGRHRRRQGALRLRLGSGNQNHQPAAPVAPTAPPRGPRCSYAAAWRA